MSLQYLWSKVPIFTKNLISSGNISATFNDRLSQTASHAYDTYCSTRKGEDLLENRTSRTKRKRHRLSLTSSNPKSPTVASTLSPMGLTTNDYFFEHQRVNGFIHGTRILSQNQDIMHLKAILSLQVEPYLEFWGEKGRELLGLMRNEILSLDLWVAIQRGQGAYHKEHVHENVFLSGVYYCKVPRGSAPLIFYNPDHDIGKRFDEDDMEVVRSNTGSERLTAEQQSHCFEPKEGSIVLFPPWLLHGVPPVAVTADTVPAGPMEHADTARISFAFNLRGPYRIGNPWSVTMPTKVYP
mmetsp:Transcript_7479/g.14175  ORF Transcript_7479/g.14175 Transcript_7479/m.14175 type:complete len:297 (-) Transcript_7479:44-934(-)